MHSGPGGLQILSAQITSPSRQLQKWQGLPSGTWSPSLYITPFTSHSVGNSSSDSSVVATDGVEASLGFGVVYIPGDISVLASAVVTSLLGAVDACVEASVADVSSVAVVDSDAPVVTVAVLPFVVASEDAGDVLPSVASLDGAVVASLVSSMAPVVAETGVPGVVGLPVDVASLVVVASVSVFVVTSDGVLAPSVVAASRISVALVPSVPAVEGVLGSSVPSVVAGVDPSETATMRVEAPSSVVPSEEMGVDTSIVSFVVSGVLASAGTLDGVLAPSVSEVSAGVVGADGVVDSFVSSIADGVVTSVAAIEAGVVASDELG